METQQVVGNSMKSYIVEIVNNETRERIQMESVYPDEETFLFMWQEGNYSCDCNRGLFFDRANGKEKEFNEYTCGESKYSAYSISPDKKLTSLDDNETA